MYNVVYPSSLYHIEHFHSWYVIKYESKAKWFGVIIFLKSHTFRQITAPLKKSVELILGLMN